MFLTIKPIFFYERKKIFKIFQIRTIVFIKVKQMDKRTLTKNNDCTYIQMLRHKGTEYYFEIWGKISIRSYFFKCRIFEIVILTYLDLITGLICLSYMKHNRYVKYHYYRAIILKNIWKNQHVQNGHTDFFLRIKELLRFLQESNRVWNL